MFEKFPKIARLNREMIITEKLDGTNAQVYIDHQINDPGGIPWIAVKDDMFMAAGSRNRWVQSKKGEDNHGWAAWVLENKDSLWDLGPGRHYGEFYGKGIGRGYGLDEKRWALFNVSRWCLDWPDCCEVVPTLCRGPFQTHAIDATLKCLKTRGSVAVDGFMDPEGIVVYHTQGNKLFKVTFDNDQKGKEFGA